MRMFSLFKSLILLAAIFFQGTATAQKKHPVKSDTNIKKKYDRSILRKGETGVSPLTTTIPRKAREREAFKIEYILKSGSDNYKYELTLNEVKLSNEGGYIFNKLPPDDKAYSYILLDNKTILGQKVVFKKAGEYKAILTYMFASSEAKDERQFAIGFLGDIDKESGGKLFGVSSGFKVKPAIYSKLVVQRPSSFKKNSLTFGAPSVVSDLGNHFVSLPVENKSEHTLFLSGTYKSTPSIWNTSSSVEVKKGVPPYSKFFLRWPLAKIKWMEGDKTRITFSIEEKNEGADYRKSELVDVRSVKIYGSKARIEIDSVTRITSVDRSGQFLSWPVTIYNPTEKFMRVTADAGDLSPKEGGVFCNEPLIGPKSVSNKCGVYFKKPNAPTEIKNLNMSFKLNEGKNEAAPGPVLYQLKIERLRVVSAK